MLKESVDSTDCESAVVMQDIMKDRTGLLLQQISGSKQRRDKILQII